MDLVCVVINWPLIFRPSRANEVSLKPGVEGDL